MQNGSKSDSLDFVKVYIWITSALAFLMFTFFLYNYFLKSRYESRILDDYEYFAKIKDLEKKRPPDASKVVAKEITDIYKTFQSTVPMPEKPEVDSPQWEPGNIEGVLFDEKRYIVRFEKGISREDIVRYIFKIQEALPFLKTKRLDIQKAENTAPHEDKWKTEIEFAFRRPKAP